MLKRGEVDFDLVEPTGVNGAMPEQQVSEAVAQAADRTEAAVRGALVNDSEYAARLTLRTLAHYLGALAVECGDAAAGLVAGADPSAVKIEGDMVGSGPASLVLVLDLARPAQLGGHSAVSAVARQDAGFLVVS